MPSILGRAVGDGLNRALKYFAEWLKTFVSDVPVEFVAAAEPFWSPA
jgi:hypothetical protein